jgi:tetratricopeptide (TPR) repeat protein
MEWRSERAQKYPVRIEASLLSNGFAGENSDQVSYCRSFIAAFLFYLGLILLPAGCVSTPLHAEDSSSALLTDGTLAALPLEPAARNGIELSLKSHDYAGAEAALVREANQHPNAPLLYSYLGRLFFIDHKYLNTAIALKKAEALQPLNEKDRFTLAMAYVVIGHPDWARPELEKLVKGSPRNPMYLYWQGRLDYDGQDLLAASDKFRKAIALNADFAKAYDNLGLCLEGLGKYDEALQQYRHAAQLNRELDLNSAWPPLDMGALLVKLDRLEEAQPFLKESLQFDANFAQAHYQLGVLLGKQNEMPLAVKELNRAAVLDEADPQPHYALARIYKRMGNEEQAKRELQIFQSLSSKAPPPRLE